MRVLSQGAEGRVFETEFYGRPAVVKERFTKTYRHPDLEKELSWKRLVAEVRMLGRCARAGMLVPRVLMVDKHSRAIYMEKLEGVTLTHHLATQAHTKEVAARLAEAVRQVHELGFTHGDLTPSNAMVVGDRVALIDFGLAAPMQEPNVEDRAVDLYVLERALLSSQEGAEAFFAAFLEAYGDGEVAKRLDMVRMRGRKKVAFG